MLATENHFLSTSCLPSSQRFKISGILPLAVVRRYLWSGFILAWFSPLTRDWHNRPRTSRNREFLSSSLSGMRLSQPANTAPTASTWLGLSSIMYAIVMATSNTQHPFMIRAKSRMPDTSWSPLSTGVTTMFPSFKSPCITPVKDNTGTLSNFV